MLHLENCKGRGKSDLLYSMEEGELRSGNSSKEASRGCENIFSQKLFNSNAYAPSSLWYTLLRHYFA